MAAQISSTRADSLSVDRRARVGQRPTIRENRSKPQSRRAASAIASRIQAPSVSGRRADVAAVRTPASKGGPEGTLLTDIDQLRAFQLRDEGRDVLRGGRHVAGL